MGDELSKRPLEGLTSESHGLELVHKTYLIPLQNSFYVMILYLSVLNGTNFNEISL